MTTTRNPREFVSHPDGEAAEGLGDPLAGVEFTLDGVTFPCEGQIDLLDVSELASLAVSGTDIRSPQGLAMIASFLQLAFGPVQYLRFKAHTRAHRTDPDVLFQIVQEITNAMEDFTQEFAGRPTKPSSSYSDGPQETADRRSRVLSLGGQGDVTFVEPGGAMPDGSTAPGGDGDGTSGESETTG